MPIWEHFGKPNYSSPRILCISISESFPCWFSRNLPTGRGRPSYFIFSSYPLQKISKSTSLNLLMILFLCLVHFHVPLEMIVLALWDGDLPKMRTTVFPKVWYRGPIGCQLSSQILLFCPFPITCLTNPCPSSVMFSSFLIFKCQKICPLMIWMWTDIGHSIFLLTKCPQMSKHGSFIPDPERFQSKPTLILKEYK